MAAAFVQGTGLQSSGSVASLSKAFTSNVSFGTLLIAATIGNNGTRHGASSCADDRSNAYTRDVNFTDPGVALTQGCVYSAQSGSAGACTVTLTPTGGNDFVSMGIAEFSGMFRTSPLDTTATGNGSSTSPASGTLTTSQTDVIVGVMSFDGSNTAIGVGGSYNLIFEDEDTTDMPISSEYRITSADVTASFTLGASRAWIVSAAAYKEAPVSLAPTLHRRTWTHRTRRVYR